MKRRLGTLLIAALLCGPAGAKGLEPYEMMRSLQLVQDRIANGDHAALPLQTQLLGIIDQRLGMASPKEFEDRRNLEALFAYGASGGNPATLEAVISRLELEGAERTLSQGLVRYARGDFAGAREMLMENELPELADGVAASLALVRGSLLVQQDPAGALRLFDRARLLSPGTLIEEAALRRTIAAAARLHETERVALAASQYVRRFLHSPYASQFAEAFVAAVVGLHDDIDLALVEEVTNDMSDEQAYFIYLRVARQSAIEGMDRLLAFASRNAEKYIAAGQKEDDPRAVLYASIASVTSPNVAEALETLKGIDSRRLSPNDRKLLRAARQIAEKVVSPVETRAPKAVPEDGPAPAGDGIEAAERPQEAINAAYVAEMQERLEAIDMLLEEADQ